MKILITGYTNRMWGSTLVRRDYMTFVYLLHQILVEMGHSVDRRKVVIGEKLYEQYDFAFCGVAPLSSLSAGKVPETQYTLDQMRGRCAVFADDWSFCEFGDTVRYTLGRWDKYLSYRKFPYSMEIIEETRKSLENMMSYNQENNAPVLAPMFIWGNHRALMNGSKGKPNYEAKLVTVDPSRWIQFPDTIIRAPFEKKRQWVMAALSNHSYWVKKQGFKLPVEYIGNENLGRVLSEDDTVQEFANSYGVLSAGYPSAGSGWWRTRYLNAAWAESIIYSDPLDAAVMDRSFQGSADHFESFISETEYRNVYEQQASWLNANLSHKETVMSILERLIKK